MKTETLKTTSIHGKTVKVGDTVKVSTKWLRAMNKEFRLSLSKEGELKTNEFVTVRLTKTYVVILVRGMSLSIWSKDILK